MWKHRGVAKNANAKRAEGKWIRGWNSFSSCLWMAQSYHDIKLWSVFTAETERKANASPILFSSLYVDAFLNLLIFLFFHYLDRITFSKAIWYTQIFIIIKKCIILAQQLKFIYIYRFSFVIFREKFIYSKWKFIANSRKRKYCLSHFKVGDFHT